MLNARQTTMYFHSDIDSYRGTSKGVAFYFDKGVQRNVFDNLVSGDKLSVLSLITILDDIRVKKESR